MKEVSELNPPLTSLKGVGPKRAALMAKKGLKGIVDLLFFMPIRYEDRTRMVSLKETKEGYPAWVRGRVVSAGEERFFRAGKRLFKIVITEQAEDLELIWFRYNKAHLNRFARKGLSLTAYGKIQRNRGKVQMFHPDVNFEAQGREGSGFYPVYSRVEGISGQTIRLLIRDAIKQYKEILPDILPTDIIRGLGLPQLGEAIEKVHFPLETSSFDQLNQSRTRHHRRLIFDHFFSVFLSIDFRRKLREKRTPPDFSVLPDLVQRVEKSLPFVLTHGQKKAVQDIFYDLNSEKPMNRLLQGDVGCGKTVVAAAASFAVAQSGYQVAVMAPTQVLAGQHYHYFLNLSDKMGFRPVLLTGGLTKSDRMAVDERIKNGACNLIIGTHALIRDSLQFEKLGLVIIDEQHRFGVRQRALLEKKGDGPHRLVMTATPIPRTLAMTGYADLDISSIREYPAGHQTVETYLVKRTRKRKVFNSIQERMSAGEQAIVICPVIEGSEDRDLKDASNMYDRLKALFHPRFRVGLIHSRLSADEKDRVMGQFRDGVIDLLVGTTVIEVGVHAEGATVMVIEHPERFGLSQLHQLRGRVGRGKRRGLCLLMAHEGLKDEALSRLKIIVENHDGFLIARKDLEIRGQGRLLGTHQSGSGEFDFVEVFRNHELWVAAKKAAEGVIASDPELSRPENKTLRQLVDSTADITDF